MNPSKCLSCLGPYNTEDLCRLSSFRVLLVNYNRFFTIWKWSQRSPLRCRNRKRGSLALKDRSGGAQIFEDAAAMNGGIPVLSWYVYGVLLCLQKHKIFQARMYLKDAIKPCVATHGLQTATVLIVRPKISLQWSGQGKHSKQQNATAQLLLFALVVLFSSSKNVVELGLAQGWNTRQLQRADDIQCRVQNVGGRGWIRAAEGLHRLDGHGEEAVQADRSQIATLSS